MVQFRAVLASVQGELEYNAGKGASAYRFGQHDALRFARDALIRILGGKLKGFPVRNGFSRMTTS